MVDKSPVAATKGLGSRFDPQQSPSNLILLPVFFGLTLYFFEPSARPITTSCTFMM